MLSNYFNQTKTLQSTEERSRSWLMAHEAINSDLDRVLIGFSELQFSIPIFGGVGDNFTTIKPWHHLFFEAEQDLNSAVSLLFLGFYKDCFRSLRSFLELNIFALYNFVNEDEEAFKKWLSGKSYTPKFVNMLKFLDENSCYFKNLNKEFGWVDNIESLYNELSGFIHTRGAEHTHTSLKNTNQIVFSEFGLKTGAELLLKSVRLISMGFVINFPMSFQPLPLFEKFAFNPPVGGFLDEGQVEMIKNIFQKEIIPGLSAICLSNEDSRSLADGVKSMPDLTEMEILNSFNKTIELDELKSSKEMIFRMVNNGKVDEAFVLIIAIRRAMTRGLSGVLFNPFYTER